jgi:hypothetical protein
MLERYFKYPGVLRRFRGGALGEEMDRIAAHLFDAGHKRASARSYRVDYIHRAIIWLAWSPAAACAEERHMHDQMTACALSRRSRPPSP